MNCELCIFASKIYKMNLSPIELAGALIGLVYIFLEYKASKYLWFAGIVMSLFYIWIFADANCYAWAATYFYYLCANIYGIYCWSKKTNKEEQIEISNLPTHLFPKLLMIICLISILFFYIIELFTDSKIPVSESVSTALSIVGMWLLAKKYVQHWYVWLLVNAIYIFANLYIGLYFTAILFTIYFVVSIFGLYKWQQLVKK